MSRTTVAFACALVAVAVGFGGWVLGGPPIFGIGAFVALLAGLVLYAYRGSGEDRTAADLRRADRPEQHQSREGPGPFGPT